MDKRLGRHTVLVLLAAALLAAVGLSLVMRQYHVDERNARELLLERGQTVLDALAAGIRAQSRRGQYRAERLTAILDELAQAPAILGIQLRAEEGEVVATGGEFRDYPTDKPCAVPIWDPAHLMMSTRTRFAEDEDPPGYGGGGMLGGRHGLGGRGGGRGGGHGGGRAGGRSHPADMANGGRPWGSGFYILTVVLDTSPINEVLRDSRRRLAMASVIGMVAIVSGSFALLARMRQRRLQTELLLVQERAAQSEKLARLGAGLAHETKNPLGVVRGLAQSIGESPGASHEIKVMSRQIVDEADRTVGQINSLLTLARPMEPKVGPLDLDSFFSEFQPLLEADARGSSVTITCRGRGLRIKADEDLLRRAILNLTNNAVRACDAGGVICVEADASRGKASLIVSDDGRGINANDLPRVTDPYFTRFENGCGLGLSIVDHIARAHGWELRLESSPGKGTRVSLCGIERVE